MAVQRLSLCFAVRLPTSLRAVGALMFFTFPLSSSIYVVCALRTLFRSSYECRLALSPVQEVFNISAVVLRCEKFYFAVGDTHSFHTMPTQCDFCYYIYSLTIFIKIHFGALWRICNTRIILLLYLLCFWWIYYFSHTLVSVFHIFHSLFFVAAFFWSYLQNFKFVYFFATSGCEQNRINK